MDKYISDVTIVAIQPAKAISTVIARLERMKYAVPEELEHQARHRLPALVKANK